MTIHLCYGPKMREHSREDTAVRWCFKERKRVMFQKVVMTPDEESYYGPTVHIECSSCKTIDGDCFPGHEREWEEY